MDFINTEYVWIAYIAFFASLFGLSLSYLLRYRQSKQDYIYARERYRDEN